MDINRFLKSSGTLLLQRGIGAVLGFLLPVYLANVVSASLLGTYFLYVSLQSVLGLLAVFGMGAGLITFIDRQDSDAGRYLGSGLVLMTVTTTVVLLVSYIFRVRINKYIGAPLWSILAIGVVLLAAANIFSTVLIGENRVPTNAMTSLVGQLITVPVQIFVAGLGLLPLVAAYNIQFVIVLFSTYLLKQTKIERPDREHLSELFQYGARALVSNAEEKAFRWTDLLIIGLFLPNAAIGIYGIIWTISSVAFLPTKTIGTTLLPEVSKLDGDGASDNLSRAISLAIFISIAFIIPILAGAVFVGEALLDTLFGTEYASAWFVLTVTLAGRLFHALHRVSRNGLLALNRTKITSRVGIASVICNIGLNFLLVSSLGLIGAAIATALSIALASLPFLYYLSKDATGSIIPWTGIDHVVGATAGMCIVVGSVRAVGHIDSVAWLVSVIAFGGCVYFAILLLIDSDVQQGGRYAIHRARRYL